MPGRFIDATPFADYEDYMRYARKPEAAAQVKGEASRCDHCGEEFDHEPAASFQLPYFPNFAWAHGEDSGWWWKDSAMWAYFCSERCAWLSCLERHRAWGMGNEEARKHLIEEHALAPPQ